MSECVCVCVVFISCALLQYSHSYTHRRADRYTQCRRAQFTIQHMCMGHTKKIHCMRCVFVYVCVLGLCSWRERARLFHRLNGMHVKERRANSADGTSGQTILPAANVSDCDANNNNVQQLASTQIVCLVVCVYCSERNAHTVFVVFGAYFAHRLVRRIYIS